MAGKFTETFFSEIDINDEIFNELKIDYPGDEHTTGFITWFTKKAATGAKAITFIDEQGVGAFICLKEEEEEISLKEGILPPERRLKISTLKIADRFRGQRLGEGAIGTILWKWQDSKLPEVYVTVFEKQDQLIQQLKKFGFIQTGLNLSGECVFIKKRSSIDYSNPFLSFPFIDPKFQKAGYLIFEDEYHDNLFPYSELANTRQEQKGLHVTNGLSKIYIGSPWDVHYKIGEPVLLYRKFNGSGKPRYHSCVTSFGIVNDVFFPKKNYQYSRTIDQVLERIGNKSVFTQEEIYTKYSNFKNMAVIELVYYGYFGKGNNVTMDWLEKNQLWSNQVYPMQFQLSPEQFRKILAEGRIDVQNTIIHSP